MSQTTASLHTSIRKQAQPLTGRVSDYDPLMDLIGDARFVLIGEASHGTHEFYAERARLTQRLIEEKGFAAVAVEADWPDAYAVNCYVRGASEHDNKTKRRRLGIPSGMTPNDRPARALRDIGGERVALISGNAVAMLVRRALHQLSRCTPSNWGVPVNTPRGKQPKPGIVDLKTRLNQVPQTDESAKQAKPRLTPADQR